MIADDAKLSIINKKLFKLADQNENGYIDRTELENFMIQLCKECGCCQKCEKCPKGEEDCKKKIEKLFRKLDTNKDGRIDPNEFKPFVSKLLKKMEPFGVCERKSIR